MRCIEIDDPKSWEPIYAPYFATFAPPEEWARWQDPWIARRASCTSSPWLQQCRSNLARPHKMRWPVAPRPHMSQLRFYHSFPRHKGQKVAFDVLESVLKMGLLLTAEKRRLTKSGHLKSAPLIQDRLCFTAIDPKYLRAHARAFGMFSLEYDGDTLRSFGAQPVMYLAGELPRGRLLNRAGVDLIRHVMESREVLKRLWKLSEKKTPAGRRAKAVKRRVYPFREPFQRCFFSLQALLNLYYPTDRRDKTKPLHFFRQREWRIIPNFAFRNKWPYPGLTPAEKRLLMRVNSRFFRVRVGRRRRISRCMRFPKFGGTKVLEGARRLIVPDRYLGRVKAMVAAAGVKLQVAPISKVPSARLP